MAAQTILIAEDDPDIRDGVRILLAGEGYHILEAENGTRALEIFNPEVDLVILDIMMPKKDGITVLKELRSRGSKIPVLILTAKSEVDDKVLGLDSGANDSLTKPFHSRELLARIRAMTRTQSSQTSSVLQMGNITLDQRTYELSSPTGSFRLANREFQILELLMQNPGNLISAERLMEKIWGYDSEAEINVVWVHMSNLRKKLRSIGSEVTVHASRGLGYMLEKQ